MNLRAWQKLASFMRTSRDALRRRLRRKVPGRFQAYSYTLPDRYPWLFEFAKSHVQDTAGTRLLSFGCSSGEEVLSLRRYFAAAAIKGIDIDRRNIEVCEARAQAADVPGISFAVAADTCGEPAEHFDAIFCLAVLCLGDLTVSGAQRCDPHLYFEEFERLVADFARCLRPGGILCLLTTNFRFGDTAASRNFDVLLEADESQLAPDVLFDRNNRLLSGERYRPAVFLKRTFSKPDALRLV
jgi:SAM-dependent methyltransferase